MSANDLYYLRSILRQLREVQGALADTAAFSLGGEALADNIDWLDCFIERNERIETVPAFNAWLPEPTARGETEDR